MITRRRNSPTRPTRSSQRRTRIRTSQGVFTLYNSGAPSLYADIDREKAEKIGLTPTDVFSTLQLYLGSQYVNDFNYLGRTYQVVAQADEQFRRTPEDISRLKVRNASGEMVPIGSVASFKYETAPYPSAALQPLSRCGRAGCRGARRCLRARP